jgi:hypothetical protein
LVYTLSLHDALPISPKPQNPLFLEVSDYCERLPKLKRIEY